MPRVLKNSNGSWTKAMDRTGLESSSWPAGRRLARADTSALEWTRRVGFCALVVGWSWAGVGWFDGRGLVVGSSQRPSWCQKWSLDGCVPS